jgi:hypothetical protein
MPCSLQLYPIFNFVIRVLGIYPLTTVAEMTAREADGEQRKQDIQRYVRRLIGYIVGRRRES